MVECRKLITAPSGKKSPAIMQKNSCHIVSYFIIFYNCTYSIYSRVTRGKGVKGKMLKAPPVIPQT